MKRVDETDLSNKKSYGNNYLVANKFPWWIRVPFNIVFFAIIALCLAIAVLSCIYIRTPVIGPSMQPTINSDWTASNNIDDKVLINRLNKGQRGDIIVIENDRDRTTKYLIKRLIATGGDKICIKVDTLGFTDLATTYKIMLIKKGETVAYKLEDNFPYMKKTFEKFNLLTTSGEHQVETIGEDNYLVIPDDSIFYLGDNRNASEDCSAYGPAKQNKTIGKVVLIINHNDSVFAECAQFFFDKLTKKAD